ncbi:hypothetical protein R84B8_00334 [Treponema sp. R8-4-B8]
MKYPFLLLTIFLLFGCTYEETKFHVYYHGNDSTAGSPPRDSREYSTGETVTILGKGNLAKGDYTFLGWRFYDQLYYTGDNITIRYDDVNLYAVWDDGLNTPFSFKIDNGEVTITRYNEQNTASVTIPNTLQSKPVTSIDDNVFSNLSLTDINLPRNLKNIGIWAFASNNITRLIIPDSVESVGLGAFRNNKLAKITFGTGVSAIAPYTFGNNQLTDVTIPDNIKSIGVGAFHENNITMIKIGGEADIKSDTSLGSYGASFKAYYDLEKKAGLYIYVGDDVWERY